MIKLILIFRGLQIVDVTPLSLGISITHDNIMSELIHRNTSIPYTISKGYTTSVDYQSIVDIEI